MIDVQKVVTDLWDGPHPPLVVPHGSQCRLMHPFGHSVVFDLTRAQLALPPQEFAASVIAPAIADLRKTLEG